MLKSTVRRITDRILTWFFGDDRSHGAVDLFNDGLVSIRCLQCRRYEQRISELDDIIDGMDRDERALRNDNRFRDRPAIQPLS